MIDGLGPYPEYRESGLPWAPRVPGHWEVRRTKTVFAERVEKGFPNEPLLTSTQSHGVIRKSDYGSRTVTATKDFHLLKLVDRGDFVISLRSFEGGIEVAHHRGIISPAYTVLRPNAPDSGRFFAHLLKSNPFIQGLQLFITGIREGQNIDYSRVARTGLPLPPPDEQAAIVRFLDHANRRIDGFIRAKRKLIALLNEQKHAIIHRAVTRGLDPAVPMKDSGIPWIGEIPAHWDVERGKSLFRQTRLEVPKDAEVVTCFRDGQVTLRRNRRATGYTFAIIEAGYQGVAVGQLVIHSMDAFAGAVGVSESDGKCSPEYIVGTPRRSNIHPRYFAAAVRTAALDGFIHAMCPSVRQRAPRFRYTTFSDFPLPVPPVAEQLEIADTLGSEHLQISKSVETLAREVTLLREYRTRLISDVVTGQLDVRAAAASLPAEAPEPAPETADDLDADLALDEDASDEEIDGDDP